MGTRIHPAALVDPAARIGEGVMIGPFAVVEADVEIGDGSEVGAHAVLSSGTRIGTQCRIFPGAVLGCVPQDLKFGGETTTLVIGDSTTIREFCTLNRGTHARGETRIGDNCLLMAYCHVAHDCRIGNNVIIANGLAMAGHVDVEDNVNIGGVVSVHQFSRIGQFAFVGANTYVNMDVAPYALTSCDPSRIVGINKVGLERRGYDAERRQKIKRAFKFLLHDCLNTQEAVTRLSTDYPGDADVALLVDFAKKTERGLMRMPG